MQLWFQGSEEISPKYESVEVTHQRHPMKGKDGNLPEKLGELISALHFLLVCRVITKQYKGEVGVYSVRGVLLDKIIGGIECELSGGFNSPVAITKLNCELGILTAERLCYIMRHLLLV